MFPVTYRIFQRRRPGGRWEYVASIQGSGPEDAFARFRSSWEPAPAEYQVHSPDRRPTTFTLTGDLTTVRWPGD